MVPLVQLVTFSTLFALGVSPTESALGGEKDMLYVSFLNDLALVAGIIILVSFLSTRFLKRII